MTQQQKLRECPGCKVVLPYHEGPYNRYGINSPECWAAFTELLAKEIENYGYPPVHRLIVDAYAVQHPPHIEHQLELKIEKRLIDASIQSIIIHLIALYAAFEKREELLSISRIMDTVLKNVNQQKAVYPTLKPPVNVGHIKAIDVRNALLEKNLSIDEYTTLAWQWAESAWNAWSIHHAIIQNWYEKYT